MDWLDKLALSGRRYERRRSAVNGSYSMQLVEVLRIFHGKTILELNVDAGTPGQRQEHKVGRPISLVDALSDIDSGTDGSFEVLQTAPSGDNSRVKIVSQPSGKQLQMLVTRRMPEDDQAEERLLQALRRGSLV